MFEVKKEKFEFEIKKKFELLPDDLSLAMGSVLGNGYFNLDNIPHVYMPSEKEYWFLNRSGTYAVIKGFESNGGRNISKFCEKLTKFLIENEYVFGEEKKTHSSLVKGITDVFGIKPLRYEVELVKPSPDWFESYVNSNHEAVYGDENSCFLSGKRRSYAFYFVYLNDGYFVGVRGFDSNGDFVGGARFILVKFLDNDGNPVYIAFNHYSKGLQFSPALWVKILSEIFEIPIDEIGKYLVFSGYFNSYEGAALSRFIWVNGMGFEASSLSKPYYIAVIRNNPRSDDIDYLKSLKAKCMACGSYVPMNRLKIYVNGIRNFSEAVEYVDFDHLSDVGVYMYNSNVYKAVVCQDCMDELLESAEVSYDEED